MNGGANLSECGTYRWGLWRSFDHGSGPWAVFVMLNPSTADATKNDPTIRRCIGFAREQRCTGLYVVNLFAYRATKPAELKAAHKRGVDIVGEENDERIRSALRLCQGGPVICAWGTKGTLLGRDKEVLKLLREHSWVRPRALRMTKSGHPEHPLYLPKGLPPVPVPS